MAFSGPGYLLASGYTDPGNVASSLASGSKWGYAQLNVTLLASTLAIFLQYLSLKLGAVTQKDLAENCRIHLPWALNLIIYVFTEIAIVATDLANVLGAAIAMNLLFGLRLDVAVALTSVDVLLLLVAWNARFARTFEIGTFVLMVVIGLCFGILTVRVNPELSGIFWGFLPNKTLTNPDALYSAAAVFGAIVMPHSLVLGSHLVKLRSNRDAMRKHAGDLMFTEDGAEEDGTDGVDRVPEGHTRPLPQSFKTLIPFVIRMSTLDCIIALTFALVINSCILIVGSAAFFPDEINELPEAYRLFLQNFGPFIAGIFAFALLISGISSSMTGTLAGQVVMEGFLGPSFFKLSPWQRRLLTRSFAIVPAMVIAIFQGEKGISELLVLSQVILAVQLPFSILPLIYFTGSKKIMSVQLTPVRTRTPGNGNSEAVTVNVADETTPLVDVETMSFKNDGTTVVFAWGVTALILGCNFLLVYQSLQGMI
jgi:manganese transport protein